MNLLRTGAKSGLTLCSLIGCTAFAVAMAAAQDDPPPPDAFALCRSIGRGINLGNGLEAPREHWGYRIDDEHFELIKKAGFDSVRIPIRWSGASGQRAPYTIEPAFFAHVDHILDQAAKNNLTAIINVHHYDELYPDPDTHLPRLKAIWEQIAKHYADRPATVLFELLNEPNAKLDDVRWNAAIAELLPIVREQSARAA